MKDRDIFEAIMTHIDDSFDEVEEVHPDIHNKITDEYKLPPDYNHTDYRILSINGKELCVHKDFVDVVLELNNV